MYKTQIDMPFFKTKKCRIAPDIVGVEWLVCVESGLHLPLLMRKCV